MDQAELARLREQLRDMEREIAHARQIFNGVGQLRLGPWRVRFQAPGRPDLLVLQA